MKRRLLVAAALAATIGLAAPVAARASTTNDLISSIPGFAGPETRHACLIINQINQAICAYVTLP